MKRFKRVLTLILAAMMLAGTATVAGAEKTAPEELNKIKAEIFELSAQLSDKIPKEYESHFSEILSLEIDKESYVEVTNIKRYPNSNGIFFSINGFARTRKYENNNFDVYEFAYAKLHAMILDRKTGTPLGYDSFHYEYSSYEHGNIDTEAVIKIDDILVKLPDYFNSQEHKIILFWYIKYYSDEQSDRISEPVELDLSKGTFIGNGDINTDGKLTLSDVSMMLKRIAKWFKVGDGYNKVSGDIDMNGKIDLHDCLFVLKKIAGFDNLIFTSTEYINEQIINYDETHHNYKMRSLCSDQYLRDYPIEELERILKIRIWNHRYYGLTYLEVSNHYLDLPIIDKFGEYKNWTKEELKQFIYDAYVAEYYDKIEEYPPLSEGDISFIPEK